MKINICGEEIKHSNRYRMFFSKGTKCVVCGIEGTIWKLQRQTSQPSERYHVNLYAVKDGREILMTKDHILPYAQGGLNILKNFQPMCVECNLLKGKRIMTNEQVQDEVINNDLINEDSLDTSKRALATIQIIKEIKPIDGADRIEAATFKGNFWQCIVGKGEFKPGDQCVFFEIDSFLPKDERYSVLEGRCNKALNGEEGYRIKSLKMKNTLSQGFCMPLDRFGDKFRNVDDQCLVEGADVTEELGVKLWQSPISNRTGGFNFGKPKGNFPIHLCEKTDQTRIQSMKRKEIMDMFQYDFEVTEKLHGTSGTFIVSAAHIKISDSPEGYMMGDPDYFTTILGVYKKGYDFHVCSRNLELEESGKKTVGWTDAEGNECTREVEVNSVYWDMAKKYHLEERMINWCKKNDRLIALQGEICGPGINGNPYGLENIQMFVFDIYDVAMHRYVSPLERVKIITELSESFSPENHNENSLIIGIQHVPIIRFQKITPTYPTIEMAYKVVNEEAHLKSQDENYEGTLMDYSLWDKFLETVVDDVVEDLIQLAEGWSWIGNKSAREGLVFKAVQNPTRHFKVISNNVLLKEKDEFARIAPD